MFYYFEAQLALNTVTGTRDFIADIENEGLIIEALNVSYDQNHHKFRGKVTINRANI